MLDPATPARRPPDSRNCCTRSRVAWSHRMFSNEEADFPGTTYHARWSRWVAPTLLTTVATRRMSNKSASCQMTPGTIGGSAFDEMAWMSQPCLSKSGRKCCPMNQGPPVTKIRDRTAAQDEFERSTCVGFGYCRHWQSRDSAENGVTRAHAHLARRPARTHRICMLLHRRFGGRCRGAVTLVED